MSSAFTAVNHTTPKTAPAKLDPLGHTRAMSHDQVPAHKMQSSNNSQHMDTTFNPHDRPYGSQAGYYHHNSASYANLDGSVAQGSQRTHSGMDEEARYRPWPPIGVAADEAKAQIEQDGTQSLSNNSLFGSMVMGEAFGFDSPVGYSMNGYPGYTNIYHATHPMPDSSWYPTSYPPSDYPYHHS